MNDLSAQILPSIPDTKTDPKANIRREMTDREKVELEMKKWQKEQKKVKIEIMSRLKRSLKTIIFLLSSTLR